MDFTVVMPNRHRFGDTNPDPIDEDLETYAQFVGSTGTYNFDCPGVSGAEFGVLFFQSLGVSHRNNILQINGIVVPGGIPTSTDDLPKFRIQVWKGNVMLVPANVLLPHGNELMIESRDPDGGTNGNLDNFIIDNVVVMYKTAQHIGPPIFQP